MSASRRFQMYYLYGKINWGHRICPLYRGCPLFGVSANRGFTVVIDIVDARCHVTRTMIGHRNNGLFQLISIHPEYFRTNTPKN